MPLYLYVCKRCGNPQHVAYRAHDEKPAPRCACGAATERHFTVPQLNTNPTWLRDENRLHGNLSATEALAAEKADMERYEANWSGAVRGGHDPNDRNPYEGQRTLVSG